LDLPSGGASREGETMNLSIRTGDRVTMTSSVTGKTHTGLVLWTNGHMASVNFDDHSNGERGYRAPASWFTRID